MTYVLALVECLFDEAEKESLMYGTDIGLEKDGVTSPDASAQKPV